MNALKKMRVTVEGRSYDVTVELFDEAVPAAALSAVSPLSSQPVPSLVPAPVARPAPRNLAALPAGAVGSPLSGTVVNVHVKEGQNVQQGEVLVTLEAMKMNTPVRAPAAGTVKVVHVRQAQTVEEGTLLVELG